MIIKIIGVHFMIESNRLEVWCCCVIYIENNREKITTENASEILKIFSETLSNHSSWRKIHPVCETL